jgi:hypothetical protein
MNPFYLLLVILSAIALPTVIYGQQKIKQSSKPVTKLYTDSMFIDHAASRNFSKKELLKMEVMKLYPIPVKTKTAAGNLSAKEQIKSNVVKDNPAAPARLLMPAGAALQNLSLKEKMKIAVQQAGNIFTATVTGAFFLKRKFYTYIRLVEKLSLHKQIPLNCRWITLKNTKVLSAAII